MSFEDYSIPILYNNFNENENEDIKENEKVIYMSKSDEENGDLEKNFSKIFYEKITQNEKDKISTNFITPMEENEDSKIEFNLNLNENNKIFETKEKNKFKILNKKPNRFMEKDALLRRNLTIFKKICINNINKKIKEIKELKNLKYNLKYPKIKLGSNKTEINNNFNKSLIEILNDENLNKEKEEFNIFFEKLKKIKYFESLDIYKILIEKLKKLYKTLYLDFIEDDEGLNIKKETSFNFEKFNLENKINETMNKKNEYKNIELNEYIKDFKKFIFNYIDYLNFENNYQKNQQLKKKKKMC